MKNWVERVLKFLGLIRYRTIHKHHNHTIKKPTNDCKLYTNKQMRIINKLKAKGKTDKQVGQVLGRTEGAIRQMRYINKMPIYTRPKKNPKYLMDAVMKVKMR